MPVTHNIFRSKPRNKRKIHIDEIQASTLFARDLAARIINEFGEPDNTIVLLCVGTDRSTGDSLGPLVGSKLSQLDQNLFRIYGTLDEPVHASNLKEKLKHINQTHNNPFIIAVDACLGELENVGSISIENGALRPGAGVNKMLPAVGDINIAGVVNVSGFMEYIVLQNTRLNLVMKMADIITKGLLQTTWELKQKQAPGL